MSLSREICSACKKQNPVGFSVPDEMWRAIVPASYVSDVVCLDCFTKFGDSKKIEWEESIEFFPVSLFSLEKFLGNEFT